MKFSLGMFVKTLEMIGPVVLLASGVPPALIPLVVHGMQLAESKPQSGAEKKAVALDAVATGIAGINVVKPGAVDPNITGVVSTGIDTVIGTIKAIHREPIA